jgi:capsular polysaccharide biosynthesis protein
MELKEIVDLFRHWIWLLIVGIILGLGSGLVASRLQEPVYEASAKALITRSRQPGSTDLIAMSDQQLVLTYLQLLKTRLVLEEVGSRLGIKVRSTSVTVGVVADTQIIHIKIQDKDSKRAADIVILWSRF